MNDKLKPALIGGLVAGVLSVIPIVATCGCLWSIGGGVLAGFLYIPKAPTPVKPGEGALLGAMAGVVAALIRIVIGIPLSYAMAANMGLEEQFHRMGMRVPMSGLMLIILGTILGAIFAIALSAVGGLIAVPLFEKRKGEPPLPPPPPQDFSAGQPGSFGSGL
ncbi:MAG: hypothetical protein QOD75_3623 [Blastocatellia bacterium]|jgi:hypothetical protein|nr:hypothetical protein [Blastocatellia bacterium]